MHTTPRTPLPKAYSYIRFSDPSQAKGDSYRRQHADAVAYCKANGLDLVSESDYIFFDAGISAYSGKLRDDTTELSRFLALVKDKSIAPGSTLIVESLDRLSRENVRAALPRFLDLLTAGINIHTLQSNKTYTHDSNDDMDLFQSILEMSRSHRESLWKSERIGAKWREKQDRARDGVPLGKTKPTWIDLVYANGTDNKPTGFKTNSLVSVVHKIFQYTLDGHGRGTVAQMLNAESIPAFKAKTGWGPSSIEQTLRNVAVLGIYQPSMVGEDGKRVARGEPITGYYPAIIDKATFDSARAAVSSRNATKSRKQSAIFQIWQGIGKCALCGSPMHSYSGRNKAMPYLRCYDAKKGMCPAVSVRSDKLEPVFREVLAKLNVLALVQSSASTISAQLDAVMGELIGERVKLAKLKTKYKERQSETVLSLIYEAEDAIAALVAKEEQHNADLAADQIVDKEDFFARLDLQSFAGRSRANSIVKRLKVAVAINTATYSYGVDRDGVRILDIIDNPARGLMFYPAAAEARSLVQTQEGTFTPALIDMDDYGDPDDHDGYDVMENPTPTH